MSCAKTAEPIEMPLGVWTPVGRRNHVLGGARIPPGEGAIILDGRPLRCGLRQNSLTTYYYACLLARAIIFLADTTQQQSAQLTGMTMG